MRKSGLWAPAGLLFKDKNTCSPTLTEFYTCKLKWKKGEGKKEVFTKVDVRNWTENCQ